MSIVLTAQAQCNTPSNAVISRLLGVCARARARHIHTADAQRNIAYTRAQLNAPSINRPPTKREYYEWHFNRSVYNADWRPIPFECIPFLWWVFSFIPSRHAVIIKMNLAKAAAATTAAHLLYLASSITSNRYRGWQICLLVTHTVTAPLEWNRFRLHLEPRYDYLLLLLFCVEKQYGEFSHCFMGFAVCLV